MNKKRKKRKLKVGRILLAVSILLIIIVAIIFLVKKGSSIITKKEIGYLAADTNAISLYKYSQDDDSLKEEKVCDNA